VKSNKCRLLISSRAESLISIEPEIRDIQRGSLQFRVMQVIFVLFFLWTSKLKCHEIHIFIWTTKLKFREMRFWPKKPRNYKMIAKSFQKCKFECPKGPLTQHFFPLFLRGSDLVQRNY